jgi:type IV pilus biogenesis/stability protein PilW
MRRAPLLLALALLAPACVSAARQQRATARVELGAAYLNEGNLPAATASLEEAVDLNRRDWTAWNKLGLAYLAAGSADASERAFERGRRLAPKEPELLNNYGLLLIRRGRPAEAVPLLQAAAEDLTYRRPGLALSNLGFAHYQLGDHAQALIALDQAVRRAPNLCEARFNRALVHQALGQSAAALADYEGVIALCGEQVSGAYLAAGKLLLASGQRNSGCSYLLTAAQAARETPLGEAAMSVHRGECAP